MIWTPFNIAAKKFLGVDIGTSSIKIVELSRSGDRIKLENYGEISVKSLYKEAFRTLDKSTLLLSTEDISRAILAIMEEAKIETRAAVFSIPDFSTFFTNFELPSMTKEELPQAIKYEARQHVPIPLSEVTLDWQVVEGQKKQDSNLKILLVAVPNEIINDYKKIAQISQLELFALEAEVFGLLRSLIEDDKRPILLVDIGVRSTTCSVIEQKILRKSHSFDMSANDLTSVISKGLGIDLIAAEQFKRDHGLITKDEKTNIKEILLPLVDLILREIEKVANDFQRDQNKTIEKIILAGGTALLPGLKEYCQDHFKKEVEIGNPFSTVFYPPILETTFQEIGPAYSIAVGMALKGLE